MYKVFIVDDEVIVRESIRNNIGWDSARFTLSGEASDGEMALSLMKDIKPDILLTDIRMPFLDGLALARIVKQTMPWVRIVILSGHDEFDYAQKAISVGVQDYILKPISAEDLIKALEKAAQSIEEERRERENVQSLKAMLESSANLNAQQLLNDLLTGAVKADKAIERALAMGLDIVAQRYMVIITALFHEDSGHNELILARAQARKLAKANNNVWQSYEGINRLITLIKGETDEAVEEQAYAYAQAVKHEVERNTAYTVSVGLGSIVTHLSGIHKSFHDADLVLKRLGHLGTGKIFEIRDLSLSEPSGFTLKNMPASEQLKYASTEEIDSIVTQYMDVMGGSSLQSALLANYLLMDVLLSCSRLVEECGGDTGAVLPETRQLGKLAASVGTPEELKNTLKGILARTFAFRDSSLGTKYSEIIRKAQNYIQENYASQDISLYTVAAHVALSSNHFCTVFAQETGQTFIEYLTAVRIRRAKELLMDNTLRTSDIAYSIGYNDPHYLSYLFKKHVGVSPREFRAEQLGKPVK